MRLTSLKLLWVLVSLSFSGCMSPINADIVNQDVILVPTDESVAENAVSFSMDAEQFATIARWLGHGNTLSIEKAVHVEQENITLDAKAGTRLSYTMGEDSGKFVFEKPYPTVKAGFTKLIGGVSLHDVTINSDGSGFAATGLGKHRFRWLDDDDAGSAATPSELPEVWCYSMPGCPPCVRARLELAAEKDLPFRIVWKDEAAPAWLATRPAFWWHTTGQQPTQADVANTRQVTGWNGVKDFTERWKASRSKRTTAISNSATGYHGGHKCPQCRQEQHTIKNNNGPVAGSHTHECESCNIVWYHADQNMRASVKERQFLWWSY